jgi:hypothetical protein
MSWNFTPEGPRKASKKGLYLAPQAVAQRKARSDKEITNTAERANKISVLQQSASRDQSIRGLRVLRYFQKRIAVHPDNRKRIRNWNPQKCTFHIG